MDVFMKLPSPGVDGALNLRASTEAGIYPFVALITFGGRPSEHYVGGTEGIEGGPYSVLIPTELLKKKIRELEGKRVFANDELSNHKKSRYVGKFVSAWTEPFTNRDGTVVLAAKASGLMFREEDPELVEEIVALARQNQLGFSYDLKDARFELKASADGSGLKYIELTDFSWRGATILKREAAAYEATQLAASKANDHKTPDDGEAEMLTKEEVLAAVREGMGAAIKDSIDPLKTEFTASMGKLKTELDTLSGKVGTLEATVTKTQDGHKKEGDDAAAAKAKADADAAAAAAAASKGSKITATDFTAAIASQIKTSLEEAVKPLTAAVEKMSAAASGTAKTGVRKSLTAAEVQVLSKYGDLKDDQEPSVENYSRAIETVQSDARLTKVAKAGLLRDLGAARRNMIRAGQQGGAQ